MPTAKPRITVTLEPRTYEVVSRLSRAGGESMSALVAQFVDLAVPSLERVVVVLERAATAPKEARAGLAAAIERAERDLLPALIEAQGQTDMFLGDVAAAVPVPAQRARAPAGLVPSQTSGPRPGRRSDPRLVTRGSGLEGKGRKGGRRG